VSDIYTQFHRARGASAGRAERNARLTKNPDERDHGPELERIAAFTMAWFSSRLYHKVLAFSPTMVNQQWPYNPALRGGAWEYHSPVGGPRDPNLTVKAGVLTPSEPPGVR